MRANTTALAPRYASERVRRPPRNFAADGAVMPPCVVAASRARGGHNWTVTPGQ